MRVLVTGRDGQLAKSLALKSAIYRDIQCRFVGRPEFDLADPKLIESAIIKYRPEIIINTAAYTDVDKVEEDFSHAFVVNAEAPGIIAAIAKLIGALVIHVSTDYVYDGTKAAPYVEEDAPNPQTVYGKSKLGGELAVSNGSADYIILRTAWVYSPYGHNFVKSILNQAQIENRLRVVDDQVGSPTSAFDLADAIFTIVKSWQSGSNEGEGKIFHCAGSGQTNWSQLARYALEVSRNIGGPHAEVEPIPGSQWPAPVKRPNNSVLDCNRLIETFEIRMPDWHVSVTKAVHAILRGQDSNSIE